MKERGGYLLNNFLRGVSLPAPRWLLSEDTAVYGLVMVALWGTGTHMLLYLAGLQSIPTELHEAAKIDGATSWQGFWKVTLPLLTPTVFFNVIINIIGSYQAVETALILTDGGPHNATLTMVLYLYRNAFQLFKFGWRIIIPLSAPALGVVAIFAFRYHWTEYFHPLIYLNTRENFTVSLGLQLLNSRYVTQVRQTMAMTLISVIPLLIVFFIAQARYIQGITITGVKG